MFKLPKVVSLLSAAAMTSALATMLTPASPAFAVCDQPSTMYKFTDKVYTALPTNVMTPWASYPADISLSQSTTATVSASATATVSAEAGIVFAKASASLGVTVGASWSKTSTWTAHQAVPKGKQGRLRLYHDAVGFTVTKQISSGQCGWKTVYKSAVIAPRKTGDDVVKMNTRAIPSKSASTTVDGADGTPGADVTPDLGGLPFEEQPTVAIVDGSGELGDFVAPNGQADLPFDDDETVDGNA